jgi:hypothetical protein
VAAGHGRGRGRRLRPSRTSPRHRSGRSERELLAVSWATAAIGGAKAEAGRCRWSWTRKWCQYGKPFCSGLESRVSGQAGPSERSRRRGAEEGEKLMEARTTSQPRGASSWPMAACDEPDHTRRPRERPSLSDRRRRPGDQSKERWLALEVGRGELPAHPLRPLEAVRASPRASYRCQRARYRGRDDPARKLWARERTQD